ncbi:MAG: hypothetical protein HYT22_01980 [Candidatus Niyogibacteria bacterium]|nr:hypothetical protein [Candidatus Niyogibacteria bacterium]
MFNKIALANSLAAITAAVYIVFYVLWTAMPEAFKFLFNAQFFGADIAKMVPKSIAFGDFVGMLVALAVFGWLIGYAWGWFYNYFSKR